MIYPPIKHLTLFELELLSDKANKDFQSWLNALGSGSFAAAVSSSSSYDPHNSHSSSSTTSAVVSSSSSSQVPTHQAPLLDPDPDPHLTSHSHSSLFSDSFF